MALSKLWLDAVNKNESIVQTAISSSVDLFGHSAVKEAQNEAISEILKGNECFWLGKAPHLRMPRQA